MLLKKRMSDLMKTLSQEKENKFEIISDLSANKIFGGDHCERHYYCGIYNGTCGLLMDCRRFSEQ
jgi:hypothetical protein